MLQGCDSTARDGLLPKTKNKGGKRHKPKKSMTRRKIAGVVLAVTTVLFLVYCILFLNQNQNEKIEKGVVKAMKNYSENLNEEEIKVLTKEIDTLVEEKLNTVEKEKLTEQQLDQLLTLVTKEITHKFNNLTENEIHLISNRVLKEILEHNLGGSSGNEQLLEKYKKQIDELTKSINGQLEQLLKEMEEEMDTVKNTVDKKTSEIEEDLGKMEGKVNEKTSRLEKNISSMDGILNNLGGTVNTLGGSINTFGKNLTTIEKQVEIIIRENQELRAMLESMLDGSTDMEENNEKQEKELQEIRSQIERITSSGLGYTYDPDTNTLYLSGNSGE